MMNDDEVFDNIFNRNANNNLINLLFSEKELMFLNFFINLDNEQIKSYLSILPLGSIIMHGSTAKKKTYNYDLKKFIPPLFSIINKDNSFTAIKKILNEETKIKAYGSITYNTDLSEEEKNNKINEYKLKIKELETNNIFYGKPYMWCNTTMDTNIVVDIRLMYSMNLFISNRDIILIDYYKLSSEINKINEINKNKMKKIEDFQPILNIFKRFLELDKNIIYSNDENIKYTSEIILNDLKIKIRNKYANMMGDALMIEILNFILSQKGFLFRIDGYTDFDLSDTTNIIYDNNSKNICSFNKKHNDYICREVMLCNAKDCLSYLGSENIDRDEINKDKGNKDVNDIELISIKKKLMDSIFKKLNNLINYDNNFVKLYWCNNKKYFDNNLKYFLKFYKNITVLPHYRYQFDNFNLNLEFINQINNNDLYYTINSYGYKEYIYQIDKKEIIKGGKKNDNFINIDPEKKSNIYFHSFIYKNIKDYYNFLEIEDLKKDEKTIKYEYKKFINSNVTKILHQTKINNLCLKYGEIISKYIYNDNILIDIKNKILKMEKNKIAKLLNILDKKNIEEIRIDDVFIFYLKGSNAINLNLLINNDILKKCNLNEFFQNLKIGNNDFDFNLCINPIIKENFIELFDDLIKYFINIIYEKINEIRNTIEKNMSYNDYIYIFEKINQHLLGLKYQEKNIKIDNLKEENYVYLNFEKNYNIYDNIKYPIFESEYNSFRININHSIEDFILIRLILNVKTNIMINCIGELIDISLVKSLQEMKILWSYKKSIIKYNDIYTINYIGIFIDLNYTLIDNLINQDFVKFDKRIDRLNLIEKFICCLYNKDVSLFTDLILNKFYYMSFKKIDKELFCLPYSNKNIFIEKINSNFDNIYFILNILIILNNKNIEMLNIIADLKIIVNKILDKFKNKSDIYKLLSRILSYPAIYIIIHKYLISQEELLEKFYTNIYKSIFIILTDILIIIDTQNDKDKNFIFNDIENIIYYKSDNNIFNLIFYNESKNLINNEEINIYSLILRLIIGISLQITLFYNEYSYINFPIFFKIINEQLKNEKKETITSEEINFSEINILQNEMNINNHTSPLKINICFNKNDKTKFNNLLTILNNDEYFKKNIILNIRNNNLNEYEYKLSKIIDNNGDNLIKYSIKAKDTKNNKIDLININIYDDNEKFEKIEIKNKNMIYNNKIIYKSNNNFMLIRNNKIKGGGNKIMKKNNNLYNNLIFKDFNKDNFFNSLDELKNIIKSNINIFIENNRLIKLFNNFDNNLIDNLKDFSYLICGLNSKINLEKKNLIDISNPKIKINLNEKILNIANNIITKNILENRPILEIDDVIFPD